MGKNQHPKPLVRFFHHPYCKLLTDSTELTSMLRGKKEQIIKKEKQEKVAFENRAQFIGILGLADESRTWRSLKYNRTPESSNNKAAISTVPTSAAKNNVFKDISRYVDRFTRGTKISN